MRRRPRRSLGPLGPVAVAAAVVLAVAGCDAPGSAEGGMGLPVVGWMTDAPSGSTPIRGTLRVAENGCFQLQTAEAQLFVVWPDGFQHDGAQLRTDSGASIADGDPVEGNGAILQRAEAVELGGGEDSRLGFALDYCADGVDIAVLTEVTDG